MLVPTTSAGFHRFLWWLLGLTLGGIGAANASGQETRIPFGHGTHAFRALLRQKFHVQPLQQQSFDERCQQGEANTIVLVILGDLSYLNRQPVETWRRFMANGGALLLATDQLTSDHLEDAFGFRVMGRFLRVPHDTADAYRGLAECPLVSRFDRQWPVTENLRHVATNRPSYLALRGNQLKGIAWFPGDVRIEGMPPRRGRLQSGPALAALREWPDGGRLLVLADHSIFINDMLLQSDNDNLDFAYQCIDWLSNRGQRKYVLFVEEGQVVTNFDVSLREPPPLPVPSESQLITAADQVLTRLDEQNVFERMIPDQAKPAIARLWLVLATLVLALWLLRSLTLARHRIDRQDPLLAVALQQVTPAGTVTQQRQNDLRQRNNYWEMAQHLARQCFPGAVGSAANAVTIHGTWWRRLTLGRQVRRVWHLATSQVPEKISARQLRRLQQQVQGIQDALADGTIRWNYQADGVASAPWGAASEMARH